MRSLVVIAVCALVGMSFLFAKAPKSLSSYQWKSRVIVSYHKNEEAKAEQQAMANEKQAEILDRDLVILDFQDLSKEDQAKLQAQHGMKPGTHLLIGKDGGVKGAQDTPLDFSKWFALIDTMPMRKQEMRE